jgi:lipoprotein-anchoring transpeptidase ErfK/SrfK
MSLQAAMVGNEFVLPQPRLKAVRSLPVTEPAEVTPIILHQAPVHTESITVSVTHHRHMPTFGDGLEFMHRHSLATFAFLLLLIGVAGIQVGSQYWSARVLSRVKPAVPLKTNHRVIAGLNSSVPTEQLQTRLATITHQPTTLTVGDKTAPISPDTIKSWLQITPGAHGSEQYIHIKADTIGKSLTALAEKYAKSPHDQVTVTHDGVSQVVVAGANGARLSDPATLSAQANTIAKTLMDAKGMQFGTPLETVPFQAVTPAAFSKMIEVNVVTKQMYLYDNGQLSRTYPISAGAPVTPTPLGQYKIYSKFAVQDMKGFNPDGSKYFQPHVHWINYFLPGGYAVHGNYWRPLDWFGVINSSHGCVSLPDDQAKQVYDWAPIGTTVITHV